MATPTPTTIVVKPSVSNTDTITALRLTTPASNFSMVENPILYGGSSAMTLESEHDVHSFFPFVAPGQNRLEIELYVLNTCLVLWADAYGKGMEVDYRSLILHALAKDSEGRDCIYLQIEHAASGAGELDNTAEFSVFQRVSNQQETNKVFVELNLQHVMKDTYGALTECTAFHVDPDLSDGEDDLISNTDEAPLPSFPVIDHTSGAFQDRLQPNGPDHDVGLKIDQDNVADDLGNDEDLYNDQGIHSGAVVNISTGPVIGVVRGRDHDDTESSTKTRKLV